MELDGLGILGSPRAFKDTVSHLLFHPDRFVPEEEFRAVRF